MSNSAFPKARIKQERRSTVVLCAFLVAASFLLCNIIKISVFKYEHYKDLAYDQITTTSTLKAQRGNIYDSNMRLLATTETGWRVFVSPKEIKNRSKRDGVDYASIISRGLAEVFQMHSDAVYKKITNYTSIDVTVKRLASEEEYIRVMQLKKGELSELIYTEAQSVRYYPSGTFAAHVLGFTGSDSQGLYGLEYKYDSILSGTDGYYLYAKDAGGISMEGSYKDVVEPINGCSIVTTLDGYLQEELEGIIERIRSEQMVSNRVTGIIMDTDTGAILAMATSSPFDPNSPFELSDFYSAKLDSSGFDEGSDEYKALKSELLGVMWSNKAISETYEPGSTFKIVTVAAALDTGAAKLNDTFSCHGYHTVGGWRIKCHKTTGHGSGFSLAYGLQMSCNPTMMTIAERVGSERFYEYVEKFGYFKKSGIDLPSEGNTIFHEKDAIGSTELATASFGQRFKVTVINQLRAISVIANGGYLVEPYLVETVKNDMGEEVYSHTVKKERVISSEVASAIADVLEKGVSGEGGAKNAYVEGYKIAAKTGTSQKFDVLDENGNSYLRIGSTVAFAPSDGAGISVIIVVDEPQGQVKYGSVVAAPYVGEIMSKALPYLEYKSENQTEYCELENYCGMTVSEAKSSASKNGVKVMIIGGNDNIVAQLPEAGILIDKSKTTVYLFTEKKENEIIVPDLCGMTAKEANEKLTNLSLNVSIIGIANETKEYRVSSQSIAPGTKVNTGTVVTVTIVAHDFED